MYLDQDKPDYTQHATQHAIQPATQPADKEAPGRGLKYTVTAAIQYSTLKHNAIQYINSTPQCNATQCYSTTIQCYNTPPTQYTITHHQHNTL